MAANRTAPAEFAAAAAKHLAPALHKPAIDKSSPNASKNRSSKPVLHSPQRLRSRLQSRATRIPRTAPTFGLNYFLRLKQGDLARRVPHFSGAGFHDIPCSLMMLTRLAVGLEPLNALDAAHRSPRSARFLCAKIGFPVGPATRRSIKRNKEFSKRYKMFSQGAEIKVIVQLHAWPR